MVNTSEEFYAIDHSDMRLSLNKNTLESGDTLEITVSKPEAVLATHVRLVIQQNGNIINERLIDFGPCFTENEMQICNGNVSLNVSEFNKHDGGTFTVQIYREKLFYSPEQESLIYVLPAQNLKIEKEYNKTQYSPGDTVEIDLTIDGKFIK